MSEIGLLEENEGPKYCKLWSTVTGFYRNNFPTDTATFNVRISFLAMTCSLTLAYIPMSQFFSYINLMILVHLLIISAATYQLYYGLKIGDKTQSVPWILVKFLEIILTLSIGSYFLHRHLTDTNFYGRHLNPWKYVVMGFLVIIAVSNIWIYAVVIMQWRKLRKEDNSNRLLGSGTWSALKEFYRNNFPTDTASLNVRRPFLAMVCSLTFAYLLMAQLYFARIMCFAYLLVIAGASYQLYYGLKTGDKKQLMPWMLLKFIEIVLMMTVGSYSLVVRLFHPSPHDVWAYIIISFLLKIALILLAIAATTAELTDGELQEEWEKFKVVYNRNYKDPEEEQFRKEIYFGRLRSYDEHNTKFDKGLVDYRLGVNPYSDYTDEELKPFLLDSPDLANAEELTLRMAKSGSGDGEQQWEQFKVDFKKQYKDATEEAFRKGLFLERLEKNAEHNSKFDQGSVTFKVGINQFSDQTPEELASMHGFRKPGTGFGK